MAAEFFKGISEFKTFVGGGVNMSVSLEGMAPWIHAAARRHLFPWIGEGIYQELLGAYNADSLSLDQQNLLPYLQRPLALLGVYEYSMVNAVQFTEHGIQRMENDHMKSAYKYQESAFREQMLETGYESKELLISYLVDNEDTFPSFRDSAQGARNKNVFLNSALTFRAVYSNYVSRRTYEILRALIEDVEALAISDTIGEETYNDLLVKYHSGSQNNIEDKAVQLIHKAVASLAIEEGMRRHLVLLKGTSVVQSETEGDDYRTNDKRPTNASLDVTLHQSYIHGNRHINRLISYLTDNQDSFPDYSPPQEEENVGSYQQPCERCTNLPCSCGLIDTPTEGIILF
jgi:hypothetical protein